MSDQLETTSVEQEQQDEQVYMRQVKSFVRREGRLTKGQANALEKFADQWLITAPEPTQERPAQDQLAQGEQKQQTLSLETIFQRQAPTTLEIGFGTGSSLLEMAKAAPDRNFLGIEVHRPGVGALFMGADEQELTNVRAICHDAVEVLEDWLPDACVDRVQIFFPDPWHKKRHHKRRLIQPEFIELLARKLQVGGIIHLATDWQHYAEQMLEVMSQAQGFTNLSQDNSYIPRPIERPLTKFEQRGHRLGHGVWDLQFKKGKCEFHTTNE